MASGHMSIRKTGPVLLIAVFLCFSTGLIFAEGTTEQAAYPAKTITYVIPFDPGGQSDITAKYQKAGLQDALGVSVIIKHMPGAGGSVT